MWIFKAPFSDIERGVLRVVAWTTVIQGAIIIVGLLAALIK